MIRLVTVGLNGEPANGDSDTPAISAEGRLVIFSSNANNLVVNDTQMCEDKEGNQYNCRDVFVRDLRTGQTTMVSVSTNGQQGNGDSDNPAISADGRYVAFESDASNLVPNDTNMTRDIFVHDLVLAETTRVSVSSEGEQSNRWSGAAAISANGQYIAFISGASNLVNDDVEMFPDVFVYDRHSRETTLVTGDMLGKTYIDAYGAPSISGNGRYVTFEAYYSDPTEEFTSGSFVYDRWTEEGSLWVNNSYDEGNTQNRNFVLSPDGRYGAIETYEYDAYHPTENYITMEGPNGWWKITHCGFGICWPFYSPSLATGGNAAFEVWPSVYCGHECPGGDWYDEYDEKPEQIYTGNYWTRGIRLISSDEAGNWANGDSFDPAISADGRHIAFGSNATNLVSGDTNGKADIFVYDQTPMPPIAVDDRYDVNKDQSLFVGAPGVVANDNMANGEPRTYYLADDLHIHELVSLAGIWLDADITQAAGAPPTNGGAMAATTVRDVSEPRVYYISPSQHIHELSWSDQNNQWSYRDLKMDAGGPPAAVGSLLSVTTVNSLPRVYYLASHSDGLHIHEYAFGNAGWSHRDVTADTNAPPVAPGSPLSATAITNDDPRVYYLTFDRHIHELAWRSLTNVWYHRDVTVDGGGLPAAGNVLATTTVDSLPRVYYLSDDQHVHEMNWGANGWSDSDVTANAGAPPTVAGGALGAVTVRDIGEPRVYYLSADQHVHELAWSNQNQMWVYQDLTTRTGGPPAVNGSAVSAVAVNLLPHVYYLAADQHVYELAFDSNNEWMYADLTNITASPGSPIVATVAGGGPLTATLFDNPSHGRLTLKPDGSFIYKPDSGFTGPESFTYIANDGFADSAVTTVVLEVTDECAPVPGNLVGNFCFARGRTQWRFRTDGQGSFTPSRDNPFAGNASAKVAIFAPGSNVQLYQMGIELEPNTAYELSFAAYSSDGRDMSLWLHKHRPESPAVNYGLKAYRVDLTTYWRWYTITFITPNLTGMDDGRLRFWFAPFDATGTVYHIDRVLLRPISNP